MPDVDNPDQSKKPDVDASAPDANQSPADATDQASKVKTDGAPAKNDEQSKVVSILTTATGDKLSSKVEAIRSKRSRNPSVASKGSASGAKSLRKSMVVVRRSSVDVNSKGNQSLEELKTAIATVQNLPGAKVINDEANLNRLGYHFQRQAIASTPRSIVYQTFGMSSVPVVCKVMLLDSCSPRVKENFLKNSARIIRFVGGNGVEPPHRCFIRVYNLFQVDLKTYTFMDEVPSENLLQVIKARVKYSQQDAREWMASLCDAVQFVQSRGIAHRRIQIEHILFDRTKAVKLAGWTHAVFFWDPEKGNINQNKEAKSFSNCHLPPEAFHGSYDPSKADNWSLAVLLAALHTRRHVFKPKSSIAFTRQWTAFVDKHQMSPLVLNLLKTVFLLEVQKRASLAMMISSNYFSAPVADLEKPKRIGSTKSTIQSSISLNSGITESNSQLQSKPSSTVSAVNEGEDAEMDDQDAQPEQNPQPVAAKNDSLNAAEPEIPKKGDGKKSN